MKLNINHIRKYLALAPVNIFDRGFVYFKQGRQEIIELDLDNEHAEFIVHGTHDYKVVIDNFLSKDITASCTCPYAEEHQYCKHQAAAMLELQLYLSSPGLLEDIFKDLKKQKLPSKTPKRSKTNTQVKEIPKPKTWSATEKDINTALEAINKEIKELRLNKNTKTKKLQRIIFSAAKINSYDFLLIDENYSVRNHNFTIYPQWNYKIKFSFDLRSPGDTLNYLRLELLEKARRLLSGGYLYRMYNDLPMRIASEPVRIGTLDEPDFALLLAGKKYANSLKITDITTKENKAVFTVKISHSTAFLDGKKHKIEFWLEENGDIYSKCDFNAKVYGLDPYTSAVLWLIYISDYKDTMQKLLKSKDFFEQEAAKFGYPPELKKEFLDLNFNVENHSNHKFLKIKVGEKAKKSKYFGFVKELSEALEKKETQVLPTQQDEQTQEIPGFVISFGYKIEIRPFTAKIRKDGQLQKNRNINTALNSRDILNIADQNPPNIIKALKLATEYKKMFSPPAETQLLTLRRILTLLKDYRHVYYIKHIDYQNNTNNLKDFNLSPQPVTLNFYLKERLTTMDMTYKLQIGDKEVDISEVETFRTPLVVKHLDTFYLFENPLVANIFDLVRNKKKLYLKTKYFDFYWNTLLKRLSGTAKIYFDLKKIDIEEYELVPLKRQIYLSEQDGMIIFRPAVVYDKETVFLEQPNVPDHFDGKKIIQYIRDLDYEEEFLDLISSLHPDFRANAGQTFFALSPEQMLENSWFISAFEKLRTQNIEILGTKDLKSFKYSPLKPQLNIYTSSGIDWFDIKIELKFGDQTVPLNYLRKAIINKQNYVILDDGTIGLLPEKWLEKLGKILRISNSTKENTAQIDKRHLLLLENMDIDLSPEVQQEIQNRKQILENLDKIINVPLPEHLQNTLRQYQIHGVKWLNFLDQTSWGGILADDMGLGKTLQILTFLQQQKTTGKQQDPNLVVVPTTLLFNWEDEINKFTPQLTYTFYYGPERTTEDFDNTDIILTTYTILTRDIETLEKYKYNYIIADESQAIKNPTTQRYRAIRRLKARGRIAMTGTPIENSTIDLFAQMNFVNPGFFGPLEKFRRDYAIAIDRDQDQAIANELQRLVKPFILRRTKQLVEQQLPPKTETVIHCQMPPVQWDIYQSYKKQIREQILQAIEEQGLQRSKMLILQGLTKLRQICDSPALLNDGGQLPAESVKIQTLMDIIREKHKTNKILVYSFFVGMIEQIESQLQLYNIPYEKLTGQMPQAKRKQAVENFQNNDKIRVFLLSLKAGGTGLNLTTADYVYLLDPWWNPAVEQQAIDRTHRIGQTKPVFAYKMICRNTIEEKILDLQQKKLRISTGIITTDENLIVKLSVDDIRQLLE